MSGDWIKAVVSAAVATPFLLWGFWPDRKRLWRRDRIKPVPPQGPSVKARASFDALLDLNFGPNSALPIEEQRLMVIREFDKLEAEILSGDFTHKDEMLAYQDILLRLLKHWAPPLSYGNYQQRARKTLEAINKHETQAAS